MDGSNGSLMAQLRKCEDADNGVVLIKLYFFPSSNLLSNPIFF